MNIPPYTKFTDENITEDFPQKGPSSLYAARRSVLFPDSSTLMKYLPKHSSNFSKPEDENLIFAEDQIAKLLKKFYKSQTVEKFTSFVKWVESKKAFPTQKIYCKIKDFKFFPSPSASIMIPQKAEVSCIALCPSSKFFAIGLDYFGIFLWDFKKICEIGELKLENQVMRVTSMTLSDEYLFSGGWDCLIRQWDIRTLEMIHEFSDGHLAPILSLKVSPITSTLISSAEDNLILVWDLKTRRKRKINGHKSPVSAVLLTPDVEFIISASWDKTIKIWRIDNLHLEASLEGHHDMIRAIAISPDGKLLASGGDDRIVKIWDLIEKKEKASFEGHLNIITTLGFSPDGGLVVSGSFDKHLKVWNVRKMELKKTFEGHKDQVTSLVISSDGKKIISGGVDLCIRIWNFDRDYEKHILQGHKQEVTAVATFPDNTKAISSDKEGVLIVWDLLKVRQIYELEEHGDIVIALATSPDNTKFASGDVKGRVIIWDANYFHKTNDEKLHNEEILLLRFVNGNYLISGSMDGSIKIWDIAFKQTQQSFNVFEGRISAVDVTSNGDFIISASKDDYKISVYIFNPDFKKFFEAKNHKSRITAIKSTFDSLKAISAGDDGEINIWDLVYGNLLRTISSPNSGILCLEITTDNLRILSAHSDNSIHIWDLELGEQIGISEGHLKKISAMALTGDNAKIIATGGNYFALKIIIMNKIKTSRVFKHHRKEIKAIALSPDQNILASGSADNTIALWDLNSMSLITVLEGHVQRVLAMKFTSNNQRLITGGADHTLRIWDLSTKLCVSVMKMVGGWISDLALSNDDTKAWASCHDCSVHYFDLNKKEILHQYQQSNPVKCFIISSENQMAFSGDKIGQITIYDLIGMKEINNFKAHTSSINALAQSENKEFVRLFSGSSDSFIKIWDFNKHKNQIQLIETLTAHTSGVLSIVINPKATKLFSGSSDKSILMWDINNFKQIAELEGHHSSVNCLVLASNGQNLYSGSDDRSIRKWNLKDCRKLPFLDGHSQPITRLAMTPDGLFLVSGGWDRMVIIWDLKTNAQKGKLLGFDGRITGLAITSDGGKIVVGTDGLLTRIWDLKKETPLDFFEFRLANCSELLLTPDDQKVIIGYSDSVIRLWDLKSKEVEKLFEGHCGFVHCLLLTNLADKLISGSDDETVIVWDMKTHEKLQVLTGHEKGITVLCLNWDNSIIYTASNDKRVIMWDFRSGYQIKIFEGHKNPITSLKISWDNQRLIVGCSSDYFDKKNSIYVWSLGTHQLIPLINETTQGCTSLILSRDGEDLYCASQEKSIYCWKYHDFSLIKTFKGHSLKITSETISQDTCFLVLADEDIIITVWDLISSKRAASLEGHTGLIQALIMTSDNTIISASKDKTIGIWSVYENRLLTRLQGHTAGVNALALSLDETLLISSSDDHSIRLWNLLTKKQIRKYDTKTDIIHALYMNLDGKSFLSGGKERKIHLWSLESEVIKAQNILIMNAGIEMITMSPNQKILIVFLSSNKMQIWDGVNFTLMSEFSCPHFRSLPVFLSKNDNRLILYFDKLIDCFTGEVIFSFQPNQDILSFFFDFKNNCYYYISTSFELLQFNIEWLATYLFKYLNYDSLSVISKDSDIICDRKMSCFPFFFSFLHLISIFDQSAFFTSEKLEKTYGDSQSNLFSTMYFLDLFLNTPLDILIQRKNTTLIVKYFRLFFEYINDKSANFYQKSRFLNYSFREDYSLMNLLCDMTSLIGDDLSIFSDLFTHALLPFDTSIYDNSLVFKELTKPIFIETDSLYTNDRNFIENQLKSLFDVKEEKNGEKKKEIEENKSMVKARIICLPGLNNINLEKTNEFYGIIGSALPSNPIFKNKVLEMILNFIWKTQISFYYKIELAVFMFSFILYNINFLVLYQFRSNIYFYENDSFNAATTIINILIILNSFYTLVNELRQLSQGITNYFKYIWNYFDICLIPLAITAAVLDISITYNSNQRNYLPYIKFVFSITMFCFWFRFLSFFRALKETSFMIRLIFNVITGVKYFVLFMVLFILTLGTSFYMLHSDNVGEFPSLWNTILVFYNTTTGDSSGISEYDLIISAMAEFYMIISTFLFSIMLINLLVSIIGDHHSYIKNCEQGTRLYELMNILCDTNSSLTTQIAKKFFPPKKVGTYLIELYNEKHEVVNGNIYEGLEKNLEKIVGDMIRDTNEKVEEVHEKCEGLEKDNQFLLEKFKEEMKKNKDEMKDLVKEQFLQIRMYLQMNLKKN